MWRNIKVAIALAATLLSADAVGQAGAPSLVRIVGYNDMDEMFAALTARYVALHPRARFELQLKSTRSAPAALIDGRAMLAPMGAPMSDEDRARFCAAHGTAPVEIPVAHDSLTPGALSSPTGVLVQAAAPLRRVSLARLRTAFTMDRPRAMRWRDLGVRGARGEHPLHLISLAADTAIGHFTLAKLNATRFADAAHGLPQSRDVAAAVAADPDAVGIANLNHVGTGLRALDLIDFRGHVGRPRATDIIAGRYPFDRQLLIYARRDATGGIDPAARSFLTFILSREGQRLISTGTKGYLPLSRKQQDDAQKIVNSVVYETKCPVRHLADGPPRARGRSTP